MAELRVEGLEVSYHSRARGAVRAVAGVDLSVESGQILGLVGESGCGKSTLARAVAGLVPTERGRVLLDGEQVGRVGWRRRTVRERRVQMVFQDPNSSLNPRRTVADQLCDGLHEHRGRARTDGVAGLLELVGMPAHVGDRFPHEFSGGQRQRLAVARALGAEPDFLIADEPVTALDASAQAQVVGLLQRLVSDTGLGILFITHDLALVNEIADQVAVMYLGQVVEEGSTDRVLDRPLHPYTRSLVAAIPEITSRRRLPVPLEGEVPDPAEAPPGCRFAPRCAWRVASCEDPQELRILAEGHRIRCHRAEEIAREPHAPTQDVAEP